MNKILFIIPELHRGGAQSVLLEIMRFTHSQSCENYIIHFAKDDLITEEFEELANKIYYIEETLKWEKVRAKISEIQPDIINSHLPIGRFSLFHTIWKMKIPHILTVHSHSNLESPSIISKIKISLLQIFTTKIVFVADYSRRFFQRNFLIFPHNSTTIYNGVPSLANTPYSSNNSLINIVTVANLRKLKGYQYALPAIKNLVKKGYQLHYHILGASLPTNPTEDSGPWVTKFIKEHNLEANVTLHGSVTNVSDYLKDSDIFLLPSERELMPMSILEAMSVGLPIIASDVGGVKEIIGSNNEHGILIKSMNIKAIEEALESMLNSKDIIKLYSQKAYERSNQFSSNLMGKTYFELFQKTCK